MKNKVQLERICPKCKKVYYGVPALSREDNKTEICSACGQNEAIMAFLNFRGIKK